MNDAKRKRTGQTLERKLRIMSWLFDHVSSIGRRSDEDLADWAQREIGIPVSAANVKHILQSCKIPTGKDVDRQKIMDAVATAKSNFV
jgi:hypothetical protein